MGALQWGGVDTGDPAGGGETADFFQDTVFRQEAKTFGTKPNRSRVHHSRVDRSREGQDGRRGEGRNKDSFLFFLLFLLLFLYFLSLLRHWTLLLHTARFCRVESASSSRLWASMKWGFSAMKATT